MHFPHVSFGPGQGLMLVVAVTTSAFAAAETLEAVFQPEQDRLELRVGVDLAEPHELRLVTPGIQNLESSAEVRETGPIYLPPPAPGQDAPDDAELFFFFHDAPQAEGWELVIEFAPEISGRWILNGRMAAEKGSLERQVVVPTSALLQGENLFYFRSDDRRLPRLYYRHRVEQAGAVIPLAVTRDDWSAEISLWPVGSTEPGRAIGSVTVAGATLDRTVRTLGERPWENRALVEQAALAVGQNLLNARVTDPHSRFVDGFHLVYDRTHAARRISHWLWSWGPSIKLLFALEKQADAVGHGEQAARFRDAAIAAARRSLDYNVRDPQHPAHDVSRVRWEVSRATPDGWVEYISTADSLFLAGWGWMSAYSETGDDVYLERTRRLVAAAERLMDEYPVVPQDWIVERQRWTPHTLDESVFGMIGFRELYRETGDKAIAEAGRRFLDSHLRHMGREGGLLERAWMREEDEGIWEPDIKGHAWVVEGYLDAHALSGDPKYLALARSLAALVMECQRPDGSWSYLFTPPEMEDPADDKGTAIWAYFFYVLHETTGDPLHLEVARRALAWCLRHQYIGEDANLEGGLLTKNGMAYVLERPMTILYSTTFFGLALVEELKLTAED